MKIGGLLSTALLACALGGCNRASDDADYAASGKGAGRYAGIGTFGAGGMWKQMAGAATPKDAAAATLDDDENVIVVIDTYTGEVRQCGDHSGVCVAMNPWSAGAAPLAAPVQLKKHAADLEAESQASEAPAAASTSKPGTK